MSSPPSPDGFERLQARMGQGRPQERVVFWRNPAMQRYIAAAACLLLVCLFGWLYWPLSGSNTTPEGSQIATNRSPVYPQKPVEKQLNQPANTLASGSVVPRVSNQEIDNDRLVNVGNNAGNKQKYNRSAAQSANVNNAGTQPETLISIEPVLVQTKPVETAVKPDGMISANKTPVNQSPVEQVAANKPTTKSAPMAERVLVVTIAEPASLAAARQVAKATIKEKPVVALNDKVEKETKAGGLWQQVKRIKQGELFARQDNTTNDDRGLLSRAYSGLKHNFDKDKSAKQ